MYPRNSFRYRWPCLRWTYLHWYPQHGTHNVWCEYSLPNQTHWRCTDTHFALCYQCQWFPYPKPTIDRIYPPWCDRPYSNHSHNRQLHSNANPGMESTEAIHLSFALCRCMSMWPEYLFHKRKLDQIWIFFTITLTHFEARISSNLYALKLEMPINQDMSEKLTLENNTNDISCLKNYSIFISSHQYFWVGKTLHCTFNTCYDANRIKTNFKESSRFSF